MRAQAIRACSLCLFLILVTWLQNQTVGADHVGTFYENHKVRRVHPEDGNRMLMGFDKAFEVKRNGFP